MGIESLVILMCWLYRLETCKKSPQTWGLKVLHIFMYKKIVNFNLQKESPDMGIESVFAVSCVLFFLVLAKRVPRHGD